MKPTFLLLLVLPIAATAHENLATQSDWERFNDWTIGDVLFPNLHLHGIGGFTSGEAEELASGGHDPQRQAFSAQAIEPGLSLKTKFVEGFSNYVWFQDADGEWDGELEEAFGKIVNIPGGLEFKGGQYRTRYGALNDKHLHAWDFVDTEMVLGRFLGDDGLLLRGGELNWTLPLGKEPVFISVVSLGFGDPRDHEHGDHEHEGEEESPHEGEEAALADDVWTARWMGRYRLDDFRSVTAGTSWAAGKNGFDRDTRVWGLDAEYLWRENGLEEGGGAFRWRNELLWRSAQALTYHEDEDETYRGTYNEWGFYTHAIYTWNARLDSGLRIGWVEGIDDFGQDERFRVSPAVTWWFDDARRIGLRAQYNYDSIASHDDEHSLWLQLSISLGSDVEVR